MRHRHRGMTLVEMMIALAIFTFISGALFLLLRGHVNINRPLQMQSDLTHDTRAAYDILTRELRHISAIEQGDAHSIQFRALVSGVSQTYRYLLEDDGTLRREIGNSGLQEVIPNTVQLDFLYSDREGIVIPPVITIANDQDVKAIDLTIGVVSTDRQDTLVLQGVVRPRNL